MRVYGMIKHEFDGHSWEWRANTFSIELFEKKEDRDHKKKLMESQIEEFSRDYWEDFDMEIQ